MQKVIMLDPGHGGRDPGAVGLTGLKEKDVVLPIALRIRELLRPDAWRHSWDIRLTRETDIFIPLARRRSPLPDGCFVSIHCNASENRLARGLETFYFKEGESALLAAILQHRLDAALRPWRNRGIKQGNFLVLRQSPSPAALVELGFISNSDEERLLQSPQYQELAARTLAAGIKDFMLFN